MSLAARDALPPHLVGALASGWFDPSHLTGDLARALIRHRLAIATADLITTAASPEAPDAPATLVLRRRRAEVMRMMQVLAALRQTSHALSAAGLRHLVIKGPALAVQTTGHWQGRPATDIDLLIAPSDAAGAHDALTQAGFVRRDGGQAPPGPLYLWLQCELVYTGAPAVPLDLHWRMDATPGLCDLSFADLWARRSPVDIAGQAVHTLDPVDALLFTAVHGGKSGWNRWGMILDAHRQWTALDAPGRDRALRRAQSVGSVRPVRLMLGLLAETTCPPDDPGRFGIGGSWRRRARALLDRTAEARTPRQSIPAALSRALAAMRMAPGPLVAADGALRAGLRPVMMPQAYHTHLRTLLRRPET